MTETIVKTRSEKHERGIRSFQNGKFEEAARQFGEALQEENTGEIWNDWATAKLFGGYPADAEGGYRRALELEPDNTEAAINLAALLVGQRRFSEAKPLLESNLSDGKNQDTQKVAQLLKTCTEAVTRESPADNGATLRVWRDVSKNLSLQTVNLHYILARLINVENQLEQLTNQRNEAAEEVERKLAEPIASASRAIEIAKATIDEPLEIKPSGQATKQISSSFYRGENCNFNPYASDHESPNFCRDFILKGHLPASKIITKTTKITAFGSCFAENVTTYLSRLGFDLSKLRAKDIYISRMGEGLVNVHSLLQQFTWALDGERPPENLWHGYDAQSFGYDEEIRQHTRDVFLNTDVFILTLGLSEIWFDGVTGGIFWRAVPMKSYDASRHKFRVCSFAETKQTLKRIHAAIIKHVARARIVFTLSPIPLAATFRPISCITANSASKAILKAALDEFLRELGDPSRDRAHYFPAFEIINELFPHRFVEDCRHPHDFILEAVMKIFEAFYCESNLTSEEAEAALREARQKSAQVAFTIRR